jgi:hypothetical protein
VAPAKGLHEISNVQFDEHKLTGNTISAEAEKSKQKVKPLRVGHAAMGPKMNEGEIGPDPKNGQSPAGKRANEALGPALFP